MTTATKKKTAVTYKINATRCVQALDALQNAESECNGEHTDAEWYELYESVQECKDEANAYEIETLGAVARILDTMRIGETLKIETIEIESLVFAGDVSLLESDNYNTFDLLGSATWTRTIGDSGREFYVEHGNFGPITRVR